MVRVVGLSDGWKVAYFDNLVTADELVDIFAWASVEEDAG